MLELLGDPPNDGFQGLRLRREAHEDETVPHLARHGLQWQLRRVEALDVPDGVATVLDT